MKILMLTPYLPYPPASGGQIRTLNLLKYLSKTNEITLIALYKKDEEKKYAKHLQSYCKKIYLCKRAEKPWQISNVIKSIFSALPFLIVRNYSTEAKTTVKSLLEKENFDVIHAETFYIMPHIPLTNIPIFLLEQTIEYKVYQHFVKSLPFFLKPFFYLDILKLKYWERFYWRKAFLVGTVSDTDKMLISRLETKIRPVVIPNGAGEEIIADKLEPKDLHNPTILFQGNFFWLQNTEAANYLLKYIFPKIKKNLPRVKLVIAGQNARNKIKITNTIDVEVIDIDTDDLTTVKKVYDTSTVFIAPIFGPGGTRLKILAAMSTGLPIISTKTGVAGLMVKDNEDVLIAKNPDDFVRKTKTVLTDKVLFEKLRTNSYLLVKKYYSYEKISHQLEIIYQKIKRHEIRD